MGRYKDYRERRRRDFGDDDYFAENQVLQPLSDHSDRSNDQAGFAPPVDATVKWFNPDKGFGFVVTSDGTDAFLHARQLEAGGYQDVPEGASLNVRIARSDKGYQVTEVVHVDSVTEVLKPPTQPRPAAQAGAEGPLEEGFGAIKWYDSSKGFGFIGLDSGGRDVFVHATALERSGLSALTEGQRLLVKFSQGKKGPEARMVELIG